MPDGQDTSPPMEPPSGSGHGVLDLPAGTVAILAFNFAAIDCCERMMRPLPFAGGLGFRSLARSYSADPSVNVPPR